MTYFGHVLRKKRFERTIMLRMGNGNRGRGRPRRRSKVELLEMTGLDIQHLKEAARDRKGWRHVIKVVTRGRLRLDVTM